MTPTIEHVKAHEQSIKLYVDMDLASIPVTIIGQYNIHNNSYYPNKLFITLPVTQWDNTLLESGRLYDLGDACTALSWDYYATFEAIQQTVEGR